MTRREKISNESKEERREKPIAKTQGRKHTQKGKKRNLKRKENLIKDVKVRK